MIVYEADHGWWVKSRWCSKPPYGHDSYLQHSAFAAAVPTYTTEKFQSLHMTFDHRCFPPPAPAWPGLLTSTSCSTLRWGGLVWVGLLTKTPQHCHEALPERFKLPWQPASLGIVKNCSAVWKSGVSNYLLFNTSIHN